MQVPGPHQVGGLTLRFGVDALVPDGAASAVRIERAQRGLGRRRPGVDGPSPVNGPMNGPKHGRRGRADDAFVSDPIVCMQPAPRDVAPLVLDSPHSGRVYPPEFATALPRHQLRALEDAWVDDLFESAPRFGATLVCTRIARACIDPNRAVDDIDTAGLADPWPGVARPTHKALLGVGLVFTRTPDGASIHRRAPTSAEVQQRIDRYYQPYHDILAAQLTARHARFGFVWHLNCHSMPSHAGAGRAGGATPRERRPDFCLGNRHGASCRPQLTGLVAAHLRGLGYSTAINEPYAGVEVLRRYGQPDAGRHSLQVEINRDLYMDEVTQRPHAGFERLRADLDSLVQVLADQATEAAREAAE